MSRSLARHLLTGGRQTTRLSLMNIPQDLRYTNDHEWVRVDGDKATVGITDYAQDALGDVVYVELPAVGDSIELGASMGEVDAVAHRW